MKGYSVALPNRKKIFKNIEALSKKYEEERIFNKSLKLFSPSFKENILNQIFGPIFKKAEFLSKNFSQSFLKKLAARTKVSFLAPNEIIFKVRIFNNNLLFNNYFITLNYYYCFFLAR
jgi:hypothetical protein